MDQHDETHQMEWKSEFTASDKRKLLEKFLADENAISLVYEKIFGNKSNVCFSPGGSLLGL